MSSTSLPGEINVTERTTGVQYRMPRRQLGAYRYVGLTLLILAMLLSALPILPLFYVIEGLRGQLSPERTLLWLGGLLISELACRLGLAVLSAGSFLLPGHSEIELRDGTLHARECYGLLRWTSTHSIANLRRFFVSEALGSWTIFASRLSGQHSVITPEWTAAVDGQAPRPMWLAPGYPREWLLALAEDLARRCAVTAAEPSALPVVPGLERSPSFSDFEELEGQPIGSSIVVEHAPAFLRLRVPPLGVRRCLHWLFGGLFVCLVAFGLTQNLFVGEEKTGHPLAVTVVGVALGWTVGLCLLATGMHLAIRRVELAVEGDLLIVRQSGLLGNRRRHWPRGQVADVFVQHYLGDADSADHWELQLHSQPGAGGALSLLAYRDPAELRWLATLRRRTLRCPGPSAQSPPAGWAMNSPLLPRHQD